jgi:FKBP-type peptidyl-prolyl cis-trans isomerase SlyD
MDIKPGMQFSSEMGGKDNVFTVEGVDGDQVNVNGNHPLAGQTLHFNIEIMGIRDATEEELSHGHVHDDSHQH